MFRKRRTRELTRGKQSPVKHVADSGGIKVPLSEGAHLPLGAAGAVSFISRNEPDFPGGSPKENVEILKIKA